MTEKPSAAELIDTLQSLIQAKDEQPFVATRAIFDWKGAELSISAQFTDVSVLTGVLALQRQAVSQRINCFHTFFVMQKALKTPDVLPAVERETASLARQQSKYHSIKTFIRMREHLLAKINRFAGGQAKALFEDIDDIRFLNFEIVAGIQQWKEEWRAEGEPEPVFYEGSMNYLLKINNDNADLINLANFRKTKFVSPPNPFFLSEDGNLQGMTAKQKQDISECMELISRERGLDLRMSASGGVFLLKAQKVARTQKGKPAPLRREAVESSFVSNAKNEILTGKEEEIRKIYKINRSLQTTKTRANQERISNINIIKTSNEQWQTEKLKMYSAEKRMESRSQKGLKQTANANKEQNLVQAKLNIQKIAFPNNSDLSKVSRPASNSIRSEISRFVRELQTESPAKRREVKEMKPKIKLIEEKNTMIVQDQAKAIFNMASSAVRPLSKKNSTFYKKIEPIAEQSEENALPTTQKNFNKRSLSQSNFRPVQEQERKEEERGKAAEGTLLNSAISKDFQAKSHIRNLNNQIKNLTIINIYKGKKNDPKKGRNTSLSAVRVQQSPANPPKNNAASFITEINQLQTKIDNSKYSATYDKRKTANNNQISKLSQQLQKRSMKSRRNQQILQQKQIKRLDAERELQLKTIAISELQQKIKDIQEQRGGGRKKSQPSKIHTKQYQRSRKMREIQSKILKDKIHSEEQKFIAHRELQLRLKQQSLKKQLKKNLKQLELQTLKKRKQYQRQILEEEKRMKQTERQIINEKNKYKEIENELEQKRLKEKLLKKIMEEKEDNISKHYESEIEVEKALEMERKLRDKMEQESLELLENERKSMEMLYEQMIQKNKRIQQQNQRKMAELNALDERRTREMQKMRQMQENFQKMIKKETQNNNNEEGLEKGKDNQAEDMQALKLRLKKQLLEEINAKRQQQQEQERQQDQRRQERLKKIEEEVARTLKAEQESLQRSNAQFLKKLQHLKEMTLIPSTHQNAQQLAAPPEQAKEEESSPVTFQLKPSEQQLNNNVDEQMKKLEEGTEEQKKEEKKDYQSEPMPDGGHTVQSPKIEKAPEETQSPILQKYNQSQLKPQNEDKQQQDLKEKYKNLEKYFKKTKLTPIEGKDISKFLDSFISSLQKPVREMLPWNKFELERIMGTKQADVFEHHSLGWFQEGKYYLIGSLQCVESIIKKYGSVKIHQVYIFDKTNPYQKQFLTKKMKTFESIGFVFQKKMQDPNKFSIRFVLKIPKEAALRPAKPEKVPFPPGQWSQVE